MPSRENRIIIACAGSGKTTRLVMDALTPSASRVAIVTYTNNNVRQIVKRLGELNSGIPEHVDVMTWFQFLLRECARPYQRVKYAEERIESLAFVNRQSARGIAERETRRHYFANGDLIYSDKIAKFIIKCEEGSSRAVTARLSKIYTDLLIDEFQDLAGWDLDVIEMLLRSGIRITLVGDPRQHIYSTNPSSKNKQYLGIEVVKLLDQWEKNGLCTLESMTGSYRCNQAVCDFTNALWPGADRMTPLRDNATGHDGIILVAEEMVEEYTRSLDPQVLRYNKKAKAYGRHALNFGAAKGLEFDRVLIVPTTPIKKYLQSGSLDHLMKSRDRLHVAVTRARHSVAFVYNGGSDVVPMRWTGAS